MLGGHYPRWNTRSTPTADGVAFLRALDALSFGESRCPEPVEFVDELELPPRHDGERGGAPDYAMLWPDRVWLVELKTEAGSHRPDQLPSYYRLAAHHHPTAAVDITYLTPIVSKPSPVLGPGQRYAHLTWQQVRPLLLAVWGDATDPGVARVRDGLLDVLDTLEQPLAPWRERLAAPAAKTTGLLLDSARATAADGVQRSVDVVAGDLQTLHDLRVEAEAVLAGHPALRHVKPWLWNAATSGGRALSAGGAEHGFELRLSRYDRPVR